MNVELHQLDLRYEKLRTHKPEAERKLVGSLAEIGQQVPVVVVATARGPTGSSWWMATSACGRCAGSGRTWSAPRAGI